MATYWCKPRCRRDRRLSAGPARVAHRYDHPDLSALLLTHDFPGLATPWSACHSGSDMHSAAGDDEQDDTESSANRAARFGERLDALLADGRTAEMCDLVASAFAQRADAADVPEVAHPRRPCPTGRRQLGRGCCSNRPGRAMRKGGCGCGAVCSSVRRASTALTWLALTLRWKLSASSTSPTTPKPTRSNRAVRRWRSGSTPPPPRCWPMRHVPGRHMRWVEC